ncbi:MAG: DUF998 domain-containing protein [Acidimicrobiales bacterium]
MHRRSSLVLSLILLGGSAVALACAPLLMPDSYDWVEHTTSESGAQAVDGAWLARLGFLLFGLAVLTVAERSARRWGERAVALHRVFGLAMLAVAAFSARSWIPAAEFDQTEDMLHSVAATVMGFAFAFGVLAVAVRRTELGGRVAVFDGVAMLAAIVLPLAMILDESRAGLFQRLMFVVAYLWYGRETVGGGFSAPSTAAADVREMR